MRVAIFAFGSRGDVEPALALAFALTRHGHEAVVGAAEDFVPFGQSVGVETWPIGGSAREFLQSEEGRHWLASGNTRQFLKRLSEKKHEIADVLHEAMIKVASGADLVVSTRLIEGEAASLAEWLNVPYVGLHYAPHRRNRAFPPPLVLARRLTAPVNLLAHTLFHRAEWRAGGSDINRLRAKVGLPAVAEPTPHRLARANAYEIQAYSRFVLPELSGWEHRLPLVGYLRLAPEQRAIRGDGASDPALKRWLDEGEPPVYFGFGSMPVLDVAGTLATIHAASATLGVRALVSAGWSDLPRQPAPGDRLMFVDAVNHEEVLPRCRVAVHHGGAGTTAASLSAGTPTVICSVFADQPFWGQAVRRLGVGRTLRFTELSTPNLIAAIEPLLTDEPRQRLTRLATDLRGEDAAGDAVMVIEASRAAAG